MKSDFVFAKEELSRIGIKRVAADFYAEPKRKGSVYFVKSPAAIFYIPVSLTSANITSFSSSRAPYVAACGPYENLAFQSMSHTWQARPCFHENSAGSC